jgi:HSP20 family molecular chaperone IbpA
MYITNYQPMQSSTNFSGQSGFSSFSPFQSQQQFAQQQAQALAHQHALAQQHAASQSGIFNRPSISYGFSPTGQGFQSGVSPWNQMNLQTQAFAQPQIYSQAFIPQQQFGMYSQPSASWSLEPTSNMSYNTFHSLSGVAQPRVEIAETNSDVVMTCELPSVNPNDLSLSVTDDSCTISGSSSAGGTFTSINRTVALPTSVKAEQVEANYSSGLLQIRMPKSDMTSRRTIKVNTVG